MQVHTIGIDIAKNVFQIHAIELDEKVVLTLQSRRKQVLAFFEKLSACPVGMEAYATVHFWSW